MKKMYLLAAGLALATAGFSQVRFGAQVIGNAGTAAIKVPEVKDPKTSMRMGMGAGIVADISFNNHISLKPSLNFLQKKSRLEYQTDDFPGKTFSVNSNLNYLELPLNFVYKFPLKSMTLYVGAGPSFGYGISGKLKATGYIYSEVEGDQVPDIIEVKTELDAFKKEADNGAEFKRFDISANAVAGLELKNGLYVNAGYMLGFSNLLKDDSYKNRGIQLTVGFLFPGKSLF